jgi:hypothetical protein
VVVSALLRRLCPAALTGGRHGECRRREGESTIRDAARPRGWPRHAARRAPGGSTPGGARPRRHAPRTARRSSAADDSRARIGDGRPSAQRALARAALALPGTSRLARAHHRVARARRADNRCRSAVCARGHVRSRPAARRMERGAALGGRVARHAGDRDGGAQGTGFLDHGKGRRRGPAHRIDGGDVRASRACGARRRHRLHDAHRRRERHRERACRAADSRAQLASARTVHRAQLRGARRNAPRGGAVRHRGTHRYRSARQARQVRAGRRRHLVSRRGLRPFTSRTGQAPSHHPGPHRRTRGRHGVASRRRPHRGSDQQAAGEPGGARGVPGGPLLPLERRRGTRAEPALAAGRHRRAGALFSRALPPVARAGVQRDGARRPAAVLVAGQRARAGAPGRAHRCARHRQSHRRNRSPVAHPRRRWRGARPVARRSRVVAGVGQPLCADHLRAMWQEQAQGLSCARHQLPHARRVSAISAASTGRTAADAALGAGPDSIAVEAR